MEDSYTVHRRRKAAARNREKTPEWRKRREDDVAATDEEAETRARMETLVRETERLEELEDTERRRIEVEKSVDCATANVTEKSQRALKRAVSPEVRRDDEEKQKEDEQVDSNWPSSSVVSGYDIKNIGNEDIFKETKKTSGFHGQTAVEERSMDYTGESPRKPKDNASDVTSASAVRRRHDVKKDSAKSVGEKSPRSLKKAMSPDIKNVEKNVTSSEWSADVAGGENRERETSSRAGNDEADEQAAALDENRHEAAVVRRQNDDGPVVLVRASKDEPLRQQDVARNETERERGSKQVDNSGRDKKRASTTPSSSKTRNVENRAASTTTTKRCGNERNVERTGYTTDSSETEETAKRLLLRRKKSPEGVKTRSIVARKTTSRSRAATTDTDGDVDESERRKRIDRRSTSQRRPSSDTDEDFGLRQRTGSPSQSGTEKRDAPRAPSRHGDKSRGAEKKSIDGPKSPDKTDEGVRSVRKSGTLPVDSSRDGSLKIARSNSERKKQIIPLSDDCLIEDFARAQMEYCEKERGILDNDPLDDYVDPKMATALRRRKFSVVRMGSETHEVAQPVDQPEKRSWFGWLSFFRKKTKKEKVEDEASTKPEAKDEKPSEEISEETNEVVEDDSSSPKKVTILEFFRTLANFVSEFRAFVEQNPRETRKIRILKNRCAAELLLAIIYCGLGAFVFRFTEGAFEAFYKCGVKRVKRDFLDSLWNFSHNMREEDWKSMARRKLMEFEEQLHTAHEAGVQSYSGQKSWSFLNAVVYCLTVITTIGYGHISPSTTTGRAITIVYAIFGIPMFLIILADFGKLFTRGIKFLWAFVRRVYYTGSCRRVRRTGPVQEVMKGVQLVYDLATFRRPSQMNPEEIEEMQRQQQQAQTMLNLDGNASPSIHPPDTPGTPAMSTFAIDDEFNLPISVAIVILLVYIFVGATVYNFWEEWGFFESFYFVFISMSTIGFGDYVPKHPIYMMLSIVYLVFGLALTSMCINVVQEMLSDSFKQASQKISATIGFEVTEEDETIEPTMQPTVEIAEVHATIKESPCKEQVAPKAKQEDVDV